jgi:hypothetical protein
MRNASPVVDHLIQFPPSDEHVNVQLSMVVTGVSAAGVGRLLEMTGTRASSAAG